MAGRQGLEPRYADPESAVLPLDDLPEFASHFNIAQRLHRPSFCPGPGWSLTCSVLPESDSHHMNIFLRRKLERMPTKNLIALESDTIAHVASLPEEHRIRH